LVSKDADFAEISLDRGFPPRLLWLRIGNCKTTQIEDLIRSHSVAIAELAANNESGILSLFRKSS
jgi:predicted nuclease of predicted toxin-antitoxin system